MFYLGVHDGSRPTVKPGIGVLDHAVTGSRGFRIDSPGIFQLDTMTLVNETVQDCIRERGFTEIRVPGIDG